VRSTSGSTFESTFVLSKVLSYVVVYCTFEGVDVTHDASFQTLLLAMAVSVASAAASEAESPGGTVLSHRARRAG